MASSAQEIDLGGQPQAAALEPDGTLWMVGDGDGGIEVWRRTAGATAVGPAQVTPLGVGFCDFTLFPS